MYAMWFQHLNYMDYVTIISYSPWPIWSFIIKSSGLIIWPAKVFSKIWNRGLDATVDGAKVATYTLYICSRMDYKNVNQNHYVAI